MNNFDRHIKDKLSDAELPVSGGLWEAIESQIVIHKEPSKFWFLFLLAAFTLPILLLYQIGESNKKQMKDSLASIDENINSQAALDNTLNESISLDKLRIGSSDDIVSQSRNNNSDELNLTSNLLGNQNISTSVLENNTSSVRSNSSFAQSNNTLTIAPTFTSLDIESNSNSETTISSSTNHMVMSSKAIDQILPLSHIIKPVKEIGGGRDLSFSRYYTARDCPTFAGFNPGMYVFGEFDAGFSSHSLTARNAQFEDYASLRRSTEKGALSLSAMIGLGYQFQNGMIAETGISYDKIKLNFDPKGLSESQNTTVIVINETIVNMDTTYTFDTISLIDNVYANATSNTFKQINIPLIIGHEFPISSKFRLSLKGGIMINVVSMSKGQIVGDKLYPIHFGKGEELNAPLYKSNVGFGYTGGLNLEADLTDNITMYAGANVKYYPNRFNMDSNNINQKFSKFGITTGLKYRI